MVAPLIAAGIGLSITKTIVEQVNAMNDPHRSGNVAGGGTESRSFGLSSKQENVGEILGVAGKLGSAGMAMTKEGKNNNEDDMFNVVSKIGRLGLPQDGMINKNTDPIGSHI